MSKTTNSIWLAAREIIDLLEMRDQRRALLLLGMILMMGFLETAGVASVMPFVALLANPKLVETNHYFSAAYQWVGFGTPQTFLLFLGFVVIGLAVGTTVFKALTAMAILRFTTNRNYSLSMRLFKGYLYQPYAWFLRRNSTDLGKTILSEVSQVIGGALMPAIQLLAQSTVALFLIALLIVIDPVLALTVSTVLGGIYGLVFWTTRRYLDRIGADRVKANKERFRASGEAFAGIKDVKILGMEASFLKRFENPSRRFVKHQIANQLIVQMPQYALQIMAVTGVMLIVQYQTFMSGGIGQALPLIAVYALAGYRLMPAIQRVYQCIASLRFAKPALEVVHGDLIETASVIERSDETIEGTIAPLTRQVELRDVRYRYPNGSAEALDNVNLTIRARSTVGIVGRTGAGKTTAVDVVLGLLDPQNGQLIVDDVPITAANKRAWQRRLGYVPQHIFLVDDFVIANIAFGVPSAKVDRDAVERAARIANLHAFVTEELEGGYDTIIGERGVRLSGGQRQRVGIARALYRDPDILIMDEATSALDNITERAVIEAVGNLAHRKTIIIIAHRLTTVRRCDLIFLLEHGKVSAQGTYDELAGENEPFRAMVNATLN